ncbi:hypothetical protein H5410_055124 [Solanum commersonii]|uniref:F-box domain-containing protein n=1 Tax=Solanum commersonii TaxID=4109 RepID=A0A9J5WJF7_SOLCO|nr:hypothetical protein H5410_055124 [Solanum commersonii]
MEKEQSEENESSNTCLSMLPEGCIAEIFAYTSPPDVCRFSLVSISLHSAADSDSVWAKFLPSDYPSTIAKSPTPITQGCLCRIDVFILLNLVIFHLSTYCIYAVVQQTFSLDKWTGKKAYFLGARDLNISWDDTPEYWEWTSVPESSYLCFLPTDCESMFPEVAQLKLVWWLQIWGTIRAGILSPLTSYTAYFVYKLEDDSYGFDARHVEVSVGICGVESANVRIASLNPDHPSNMELDHKPVPKLRDDGWFELELGNFLTEREDDCIELRMEDVKPGC